MKLPQFQDERSAQPASPTKPRRHPSIVGLLVSAALLLWWTLYPPAPELVERYYSRLLYPLLARLLVGLSDSVTWSLAVPLLLLLLLLLIISFARSFWWGLRGLISLYLAFVLLWGANYQRLPLAQQLGLDESPVQAEEMATLAEVLLEHILENAEAERDASRALEAGRSAMQSLQRDISGVAVQLPQQIKTPLPEGWLLRWGGASGVISPLTLEAHVDPALPSSSFIAIALHELAHIAGYAGEADADLLAALAGLQADDGYMRYAMALRLFQMLPRDLRRSLQDDLPEPARQDLAALQAAYERHRAPLWLREAQRSIYDGYLRSQGVEAGIADYGRTPTLLVQAQRQGWLSD